MGNSQATEGSNRQPSGSTDPKMSENADTERGGETEQDESGLDCGSDLDFRRLFHVQDIHLVASEVRQAKAVIYEQCHKELKESLENLENRTDVQMINFSRFSDMLKSCELGQADLLKIFNLFDYEGRGSFEAMPVLQLLKKDKTILLNVDLKLVLERFENCSWTPGFVDVYIDRKDGFKQHGMSILEFLLRNRPPASVANCRTIELFEAVCKLRERIVKSRIKNLEFPRPEDVTNSESTASTRVQAKPILKKEDSVSEDRLLPEDVKEEEQEDEVHSGEALLLWYVQLVTATAKACLPVTPELLNIALSRTRAMVSQLLPLCLCHDSKERPSFLNMDCFREMGSLIPLFPEKAELLNLSLSFHLATGCVSEILQSLTELNAASEQIDCSKLISKMEQVRRRLLKGNSGLLQMNLLGCDAEGNANKTPSSVLETDWKQPAFFTKPGETKVNFVFECSNWAEITRVKIKVESGNMAPSYGFIFVLAKWNCDAGSSVKKELEKFSTYDSWNESDYKSQSSKRSVGGSCVTYDPVAYFSTKDRNEVDIVLDNSISGRFIIVKFLEPRDPAVDHLGIVGVKFYGIRRMTAFDLLEQQMSRRLLDAERLESNQLAVQAVLRFLLLTFCCQAKKNGPVLTDSYHFRKTSYSKVNQKTGVVAYDLSVSSSEPLAVVVAKMPFSKDFPYHEIEILSSGRTGSICVGAVSKNSPLTSNPGWDVASCGYVANIGDVCINGETEKRGLKVSGVGDRMGCGVEFQNGKIQTVYFTQNGVRVFTSNLKSPLVELFPAVSMESYGEKVRLLCKEPWRMTDNPAEKVKKSHAAVNDFVNPTHLDLSNVTIETLWETYKKFPQEMSRGLVLQLIHSVVLQLNPDANNLKRDTRDIFDHLCHLLDRKNENEEEEEEEDAITRSARDIIKDGVKLFFPCKEALPKMLLDLLQNSLEESLTGSKLAIFQSLCYYFSNDDLDALMPLPASSSHLPQDVDSSGLCSMMDKLFSISFRDSLGLFRITPETDGSALDRRSTLPLGNQVLSGKKKSEHLVDLLRLFNQLQARLFGWVGQQLSKSSEAGDEVDKLERLVVHYCCELIEPKAEHFLARMKLLKDSDLKVLLSELDTSFLATTLPELVLLLLELSAKLSSCLRAKLLDALKPLLMTIRKLLVKVPDLLPSLDDDQSGKLMEKELKSWEVDSHLTDRPSRDLMSFSFAGATHFDVEFDKRCETEEMYEDVKFFDMSGNLHAFCGPVGSSRWPMTVRLENTSAIGFSYRRDISSNAPGYNFKVKAMQIILCDFHWLYDLYLSFCRLFGRMLGSVLDKTPVLAKSATSEEKLEMQMYQSELWTTIFRGGLTVKKFERSLSGNYETADQSDVATFLYAVAEFNSEKAKTFINRCKSHHAHNHSVGGEEIDGVIASVFAALLWHAQSLRHDVSIYLRNEFDGKISDGIREAFAAAENLRLFLAEKRQSMRMEIQEQQERKEEEGGKEKEATVDIVQLMEDKSKFLLQFAGLSKVAQRAEEIKRKYENRRSRQQSLNRCLSHEPSVDLSNSVESKYPSFRLVFDFIQDMAWTKDKVEELLKKRYTNSENLWKTYSFIGEFFRTVFSEHLENDTSFVAFIRELLASQDKFGRHYADRIDGCGLNMEANVRSSYYGLLRHLVTAIRKDLMASSDKSKPVEFEVMVTCALHLLDIDWQAYDLPFLVELRLPELYFSLAKDNLPPASDDSKEFGVDETEEEYRRNLEWAKEAQTDLHVFRVNRYRGADEWLAKHIIARFQKLPLGTSYRCDGCREMLSTDYYRCLDCSDVDVCKTCYENENIPASETHSGEHSLIHFRYACNGCSGFITSTRWHCNECYSFDLCNGCYNSNRFPESTSHNSDHDVSKIPTPKVHQGRKSAIKDPVKAYFHLHSWMLFSTVALSTLDFLLSRTSEEKIQKMDETYWYPAHQLYSMCLDRAVEYLMTFESSTDEVDSEQPMGSSEAEANAAPRSSKEAPELGKQSLVPKIIGLIAALIPSNSQSPAVKEVTEVLSSEKFLTALFDIARDEKLHDAVTRHMALGLLGRLLQQMNISTEASQSVQSSASGEVMIVDPKALNLVQNLFSFGVDCLTRHGLELAKSTSQVLNDLQKNPTWTQLLNHQFSHTVDLLQTSATMPSIFALFVFTGFPDMLTVGTSVSYLERDKEAVRSVVSCKMSDEATCTIVELASRKRKRMKDILLDVVSNSKSFLTDSHVSQFIKLIIDVVNQKVTPGLPVDAQTLWQLALVIKASAQSIRLGLSTANSLLYENSFLQCVSHLASLGTGLSKNLLLRDIEILSLELNKRCQTEPSLAAEPEAVAMAAEEEAVEDDNDDAIDAETSSDEGEEYLESRRQHALQEEFRLFDVTSLTLTGRVDAAEENMDTIPSEPKQKAKKKQTTLRKNGEIDTGFGIGRHISDLLNAEIEIDECIEETDPEKPCLIMTSGDEDREAARKRKEKSLDLLEKLMKSKEKGILTKVNRALAILYARRMLLALLSDWPEDKAVEFTTTVGPPEVKRIASIFFILHLLVGPGADKTLEKVIKKLVNCCPLDDIVSVAVTSSFFVAATEDQVVTVSKQLPPPPSIPPDSGDGAGGSTSRNYADEVYIPGASTLKVELDKSTCADCDVELVFSSSSDMVKNRQCYSGRSSETWEDFTVDGDHLYCTLNVPDLTSVSSSCKFKVTGILSFPDHFDVGYLALNTIFDKPETVRLLPVDRLWKLLVCMANRSAKTQRLKAIQLLLKLLSLQTKTRGCQELSVDLSLLKGLFQMYQKMVQETKESTEVRPAIVLALTELFFVAENVAKEWNVVNNFETSMTADGSASLE